MPKVEEVEEPITNFRIILSPSGNFIIVNENKEIIKENGSTIYFSSKTEAENYIKNNLNNPNKANVGAVLMAVDLVSKNNNKHKHKHRHKHRQMPKQKQFKNNKTLKKKQHQPK
jgi:hypothetical protein